MSRYRKEKKVETPFKERQVPKLRVQVARQVYIGNRPPGWVYVYTPTDALGEGHWHTDDGRCLKYGC